MDERDKLMKGLDLHKPDWWIVYADQTDLRDLVRAMQDEARSKPHAMHEVWLRCTGTLRQRVADEQFVTVRAAIECGLVNRTN